MSVFRTLAGLLLPAFLIFSFPSAGHAQSQTEPPAGFDCEKATGVDERIICSDPLLRQTDADLARRYEDLIRSSSNSSYVATLRADEHGWIMLRNKECRVTKTTKVGDDNRDGLVDCFLDAYDERLADLDQMKASPGADPTTISAPIRKSLFSLPADHAALSDGILLDTGLFADSADHPLLAWQPDGGLVALGKGTDSTSAALYLWHDGKPSVLLVPQIKKAGRFERICARGAEVYLAGQRAGVIRVTVATGAVHELQASDARVCGGDPSLRLNSLVLQGARFVQGRNGDILEQIDPAIRIDRRYPLRAAYLPFAQEYVVAAAQWPADMRMAIDRRWAKTNCLAYWHVSAKTGQASRQCIPYGDYLGSAPQPLPTAAGTYFAVHGSGLYRIGDGGATQMIAGQVDGAEISADGCRIAFAGAPVKDGKPAIRVLDACKAR